MVAEKIISIFEKYRMQPTEKDQFNEVGKALFIDKVQHFIGRNAPIEFVMLGFPFKSTNDRDKVLGKVPDKGEEISIETFSKFIRDIYSVYSHGARVNVASDGYVFNDLLEVEDDVVQTYKEMCLDLTQTKDFKILDLHDFFNGALKDQRERVMKEFGISNEQLREKILFDPDTNYLYRGMIRFMGEELAMKSFPSKSKQQAAAKKLANDMMFRNEAYSNFVRKEFASSIRLSMHPSLNNGAKYSFDMIPNSHHSAWHSAVLVNGDVVTTIHKKDALENGYELVIESGRPMYFIKN